MIKLILCKLCVIAFSALLVVQSASAETYVCFWQDKPDEPKIVFVTDDFVGG